MNKKTVIYQVLPRLFGNLNTNLFPYGTIDQCGCGKFDDFTDKALKAINALGVTHIWYTGVLEHATQTDYTKYGILKDDPSIVKGKAGSPYAIKDYYDVDPDLANNVKKRLDEFKALIKRTHEAGMKVIIDFVPNHVARQYHSDAKPKGVKDLGENDVKEVFFDRDNNFYYLPGQAFEPRIKIADDSELRYHEFPAKATGNDYFRNDPSIYDWYETVKLNYGVDYHNYQYRDFSTIPNTWKKMLDILNYWANMGVDGFRCDMAEMVPVEFWSWVIPQVKEVNNELTFIAETYDPNQYGRYLNEGHFDYLYDKVGLYDTLRKVVTHKCNTGDICHSWQSLNGHKEQMLNFMENHDEHRIGSIFFADDAIKGRPAMLVSATISQGPVMVYSGQEFGEQAMDCEGFSGPDGRTTIFDYWAVKSVQRWINNGKYNEEKLTAHEKHIYNFYKKLLNLCITEKALSEGDFFDLMYVNYHNPEFNSARQYAYMRKAGKEVLLIVANFDDNDANIKLNIPQHAFDYFNIQIGKAYKFTDLLTGDSFKEVITSEEPFALSVKAQNGVILKFERKDKM